MKAVAIINNPISTEMLRLALEADQLLPEDIALVTLRPLKSPWFARCSVELQYPTSARLHLMGQWRFLPYYWRGARLLNRILRDHELREIYLVNNDNLLTNHLLASAAICSSVRFSVLAEGLMNFQDIQPRNRAAWRIRSKRALAASLGLRSQPISGHLSGAFEPAVSRVISFVASGLLAPGDKVCVLPFKRALTHRPTRGDMLLYVETALWQWMSPGLWRQFADRFVAWLRSLNVPRLLIKPHPNYPASAYLRERLPAHSVVYEGQSVESVAGDVEAATVVGTCCSALVTLKLIRPDINCVDFGSDLYLDYAYNGDKSVLNLMQAVGVEVRRSSEIVAGSEDI